MMGKLETIVLSAAVVLLGCSGGERQGEGPISTPVAVVTVPAQVQRIGGTVEYSGMVVAQERAEIATRRAARIVRIYVEEGDAVGAGDRLIDLDAGETEAGLARAEAGVREAELRFETAKRDLERYESLFRKSAATEKELENVRMAYEKARSALAAALERRKRAEQAMSYLHIEAPFDGVVAGKLMDEGDLADPGRTVLILEKTGALEVETSLPESAMNLVEAGMEVDVVVPDPAAPGSKPRCRAVVSNVVPSVDPKSRQFRVRLDLRCPGRKITPGMFVRVAFPSSGEERIVVPREALFRKGQLEGLFVVLGDSIARLRWVRSGKRSEDGVEILSGLDPGEKVVVSSDRKLLDGARVKVR